MLKERSPFMYACRCIACISALCCYTPTQGLHAFREGGSTKKPRRRKQAQSESEDEESEDEESDGDFGMEPLPSPRGSSPPGSPPTMSPGQNEAPYVVCCLCLCGLLSMPSLPLPGVVCLPGGGAPSLCFVFWLCFDCLLVWHLLSPFHCCCSLCPSSSYIAGFWVTPCFFGTACETDHCLNSIQLQVMLPCQPSVRFRRCRHMQHSA